MVAVNDGVIKKIGESKKLGRYVVLQDVYGNRYTYAHLGSVAQRYPVPKADAGRDRPTRSARRAHANEHDPTPAAPASAGSQPDPVRHGQAGTAAPTLPAARPRPRAGQGAPVRAPGHAGRARGRRARADARLRGSQAGRVRDLHAYFSRPFGLDPSKVRLQPPAQGLARDRRHGPRPRRPAPTPARRRTLDFSIRPAGRGAPRIDPKPILDGWKLLEATAIYRASGRNVLLRRRRGRHSIGQILLLPKPLLERRVLSDERIEIYAGGRDDIRSGQIDRRVLATLEYLAESGLSPPSPASSAATASTRARATSPSTAPATRSTSPRSTASRSSATRSRAGSPSRRCAG